MKRIRLISILTIFIGSFLVFGVQPMVGNTLLPFFGGTAAVWTVCLAAFQTLLLAGYFYADRMKKLRLHVGLLVFGAVWVGVVSWKFREIAGWAGELPVPALGALLAVIAMVGVPYVLLSSNASLIQSLASKCFGKNDRSVYKLYAVSNAGSFCGLLAYPLLMEPSLGIGAQWMCFAAGVAVYAVCAAVMVASASEEVRVKSEKCEGQPTLQSSFFTLNSLEWLGLSALSCFVLNGVSAHLCNDVAPLPLLWAVMLALYLASWIFGFTDRGAKVSPITALLTVGLVIFGGWHIIHMSGEEFFIELGVGLAIILFGCWTIHARLFRLRPDERLLTRYYLMISLGGAIGGTAASLLLPAVSSTVVEYPVALALLLVPCAYELWIGWIFIATLSGEKGWDERKLDWRVVAGFVLAFAVFVWHFGSIANGQVLFTMRNFYGTGRVLRDHLHVSSGSDYDVHMFEHAGIQHGMQPIWIGLRSEPTMCFGHHAGGLAIKSHPKYKQGKPMRVAVAGMGIATLATYAREGDSYRFYEINPQVAELAANTNYFWYVSDCKGKLDIVVDDARRALEKERTRSDEKWDVLIIDVFSGDSIPPHMSTREAFQLYLDRLAPDGILAMHLTNWHLALSPMVKAAAREMNLYLQGLGCFQDKFNIGSYWTFFTREPADFYIEGKHGRVDYAKIRDMPLMTDEKHSLLPYVSMDPMPEFE